MSKYSRKITTTINGKTLGKNFKKIFLIDAEHEIDVDSKPWRIPAYIQLKIVKQATSTHYMLSLFAWSNEKSKNVAIEDSFLQNSRSENLMEVISLEYEPILDSFVKVLESIKRTDQLKEFIYRMENIVYVFHYKLLNMFTQKELEDVLNTWGIHPKINTALLKVQKEISWKDNLFLSNYFYGGFYADGIEISTDLSEDDYPTIDYYNEDLKDNSLTKQEILKILGTPA